jgi:intraflagellar transport protein 80
LLHSELVSCLGWANSNQLFSCGDDHQLLRWNITSVDHDVQQVTKLGPDVFATDLHWFPVNMGGKRQATAELFVMASTDGITSIFMYIKLKMY